MVSIEGALFSILSAAATNAGSRVYPQRFPDNTTYPAISYNRVSNAITYSRDGDDSQDAVRFQLDLVGTTYEQARALEQQAKAALSFYSGTPDREAIGRIYIQNVQSDFETGTDIYRMIMDIVIWHNSA